MRMVQVLVLSMCNVVGVQRTVVQQAVSSNRATLLVHCPRHDGSPALRRVLLRRFVALARARARRSARCLARSSRAPTLWPSDPSSPPALMCELRLAPSSWR